MRNEETRQERRVLLIKTIELLQINLWPKTHCRLIFIAVLTVHVKTSLLYTFQRSMQANRNINLWQEKTAANLPLQTCDKNQWTFFVIRHMRRL